jgi:copper homeostasis protein
MAAHEGGAPRVELCAGLAIGGITPSIGAVAIASRLPDMQTFVMVRPREGDYVYSKHELRSMVADIKACARAGAHGIVSGALLADGRLDIEGMKQLIGASNLPFAIHRAFDIVPDQHEALEQLVELGVMRALTSGGFQTTWEGRDRIKKLVEQAGNRIEIMPGSGIRTSNIVELAQYTGAKTFHGSLGGYVKGSVGGGGNVNIQGEAGLGAGDWYLTNVATVKEFKTLLETV